MKVTVAIDSLKGSLSSLEAGQAIAAGVKKVYENAEVFVRPLADGGEGTLDALVEGMNGIMKTTFVTGPLGETISARYGVIDKTKTAIMEMSQAAGITLVPAEKRNPYDTTTYGVGQLIKDAIEHGCRRFVIGIGGSATNDGGVGMLQALGFDFWDEKGQQIPFGAIGLSKLKSISDKNIVKGLRECEFRIACDVVNPLCGPQGCSAVYGPQKGATPEMIEEMDQWLGNYAFLAKEQFANADPKYPGTGAAGGLGFAFLTFFNASLESGIKIVLEETQLETYIADADIVITGEGRLDEQTAMGKAPIGVARLAKKYDKPVIAFAGSVTKDAIACNTHGIDAFFPILRSVVTLEEAMDKKVAAQNMESTVEQVFRLLSVGKNL